MPLYAGLDCSGTPNLEGEDGRHDPYTPCVVALEAERLRALQDSLAILRARYNMVAGQEYHGHSMSEEMQADFLEITRAEGMLVGALLIDKAATRQNWRGIVLPSPADFQMLAMRAGLEAFVSSYCLTRLWCDEDIRGKKRQKQMTTEILRVHRAVWTHQKSKVGFIASSGELMVQAADVAAYGLACHARGSIRSPRLKRQIEAIQEDPRNVITGPTPWRVEEE